MENQLTDPTYAERVKRMHPQQRAALLRNFDALVADAPRWEALSAEMRATLTGMADQVRQAHGGAVLIPEN
ncbi:hypothetical protein [Variovorax sp. JS1663]|uniref:hypothetical protein n=1 Tax=Variovorax sp. JS1663 TaxID=1851577 RepID=UPI000B3455C4|nr:hypothetical protein [Variovorax sp. JS1663]OUM01660.1 hypothetical protein A8M77_15415 [Variovorax sp. JS1663]